MMALREGIDALGLKCTDALEARLLAYAGLLSRWNRVYNLTRVPDEKTFTHHLLDSLSILPHVGHPGRLIDVGSGGGLPGVPLAIMRPDTEVVLLDSNGKKTRFLEQARIDLGLDNVTVVHCRVEDFDERFDVVTSRAFASLADFSRMTAHLLSSRGVALAMKGALADSERVADMGPLVLEEIIELNVPGIDARRHLCKLRLADATEPE